MTALMVLAIISTILILLLAVVMLLVVVMLFVLLNRLTTKLGSFLDTIEPKLERLLEKTGGWAEPVAAKIEKASGATVNTTATVFTAVDKSTLWIGRIMTFPLIYASAGMTGIRRGVRSWRQVREKKQE